MSNRRLLVLQFFANLEALQMKYGPTHAAELIAGEDLGGYFELVYTVYFPAPVTRDTSISWQGKRYPIREIARFQGRFSTVRSVVKFLWEIMKIVRREKIDVICAHDPFLHGFVGLLVERLMGVPCLVVVHSEYDDLEQDRGKGWSWRTGKLGKAMSRFVLSHAKLIWVISQATAKWAERNGARRDRIRLIPHGINMERYRNYRPVNIKEQLGISGKLMITSVCRLSRFSPEKHVDDSLEALAQVIKRWPELKERLCYVIAGSGSDQQRLEHLASELGIADNVRFLGYVPYEQIASLRSEADVNLCLNGGFSLIEGAASGVPVIAYSNEWHGELIRNGESGILLPPRDVEGIAEAIIYLLKNPMEAARLGARARELAFARHSLEAARQAKIQVYEELLSC